ncbi:hypothetical protein [Rhodococcoides fascians]|uniref:hypothetical protein n=1 Tax=Rhodococcoides fascians TaxID=1828 RepID=UPI00050BFA43|nr:hypothetical protein [Rhodococcus fascians]
MSNQGQWDIGDPEPAPTVQSVQSLHFDDTSEYDEGVPLTFNRTIRGDWKGYLFGGNFYYHWDDLVRRFGPLEERPL